VANSVLVENALAIRFFGDGGDDRLLLVNLGRDLRMAAASEPLLASPEGRRWHTMWSSESFAYGGHGTPPVLDRGDLRDDLRGNLAWFVPGETAVVLAPRPFGREAQGRGEGEEEVGDDDRR
jgi:maltooligosyltrehalose trehalohydrolase